MLGHEAWFTKVRPPFDWSFATSLRTLLLVAAAVAITLGWRWIATRLPRPELPFLRVLSVITPWVPRLLAVHAGVSLLAQASRGTYLAPSLHLPSNPFGTTLAIVEGIVGVWLITGFRVRVAAWLLVAAGPLGVIGYGFVPILERVDLLGIALFLAILPPVETAAGAARPPVRDVRLAVFVLRLLVGASLVVLAFTEKLARPGLALAFLDRYPAFNVLRTLGLEVSDLTFVRIAGAVELLFGLLLLSGALPQLTVILAGIPFNATLFFLGASELIGHLPLYGAMLALLVYGSDPETAPLVPWLPGFRAGGPSPLSARPEIAR
jgi:uncharacterized membrane protein YphA (DoxX/SURF4 family)